MSILELADTGFNLKRALFDRAVAALAGQHRPPMTAFCRTSTTTTAYGAAFTFLCSRYRTIARISTAEFYHRHGRFAATSMLIPIAIRRVMRRHYFDSALLARFG